MAETVETKESSVDIVGIGEVAESIASLPIKYADVDMQKAIWDKKIGLERVKASRDVLNVQQKEFTKRHSTVGRTEQVWINQSDETLNALNKTFYTRRWRRRGVQHELRLSPLDLLALGPLMEHFALPMGLDWLSSAGSTYRTMFEHVVDHAHELNRTANAGEMNFALPAEVPGLIDQGIYEPSQMITPIEKESLVEKVAQASLNQYTPPPPTTPPVTPKETSLAMIASEIARLQNEHDALQVVKQLLKKQPKNPVRSRKVKEINRKQTDLKEEINKLTVQYNSQLEE
jgi:hypothetical protein